MVIKAKSSPVRCHEEGCCQLSQNFRGRLYVLSITTGVVELQDCSFAVFKNSLVMSDAFDIMKAKFVLSFAILK
jgi:hypothetical protein